MKKYIIILLISVLIPFILNSCVSIPAISKTSGVNQSYLNKLPKGVQYVFIEKETPMDELHGEIVNELINRGHRIQVNDTDLKYITTEGTDVGQSTLQRMVIKTTSEGNLSTSKIITEWMPGTSATTGASAASGIDINPQWAKAKWEVSRLGIAFAESLAIGKEIPDARVYVK